MIAVLYETTTGNILQTVTGSVTNIEATANSLGVGWIEVSSQRDDYDSNYKVVNEKVIKNG